MATESDKASTADRSSALGRRAFVVALLAALTFGAAILRLAGIGFLLPGIIEPDGGVLPYQLERIEQRLEEPKRDFYAAFYPSLITRFAQLAPSAHAEIPTEGALTRNQALALAADRNLRVRRTVAVLSAFTVPLTYLLARHFLSSGWSLVAAAFMATSFLHQWFAQQSRPHAAATTFFTLALLAALYLRRRGTWLAYAFAGATLGLAIGALQNGIALVLPVLCAVFWCETRGRARRWVPTVLGVLAIAGSVGWSFYLKGGEGEPLTEDEPLLVYDAATHTLRLSGHEITLTSFDFGGVRIVWNALWCYEPTLTIVCLAGLALFVVKLARRPGAPAFENRGDAAVVLAFLVPYAFVVCLYAKSYQRFVIPMLPVLAVFAAWSIGYAVGLLRGRGRRLARLVVGLPLLANGAFAVSLARVRSHADTIERAAQWFRDPANFDRARQKLAVLPPIDFPLPHTDASLERYTRGTYTKHYPWMHFQKTCEPARRPHERYDMIWLPLSTAKQRDDVAADPEFFVRGLQVDFVVVHALEMVRFHPAFTSVRGALMREAQLVARFSPDVRERELPLDFEDFEHYEPDAWAWRSLFAESSGPVIEIYRLRRGRGSR